MQQIDQLLKKVSFVTGVSVPVITGPRRTRMVSYARFLAVSTIQSHLPWMSLEEISLAVGGGSHGQAIHALKRTKELIQTDRLFAQHAQLLSIKSSPN